MLGVTPQWDTGSLGFGNPALERQIPSPLMPHSAEAAWTHRLAQAQGGKHGEGQLANTGSSSKKERRNTSGSFIKEPLKCFVGSFMKAGNLRVMKIEPKPVAVSETLQQALNQADDEEMRLLLCLQFPY